jgi:hypothetical protein
MTLSVSGKKVPFDLRGPRYTAPQTTVDTHTLLSAASLAMALHRKNVVEMVWFGKRRSSPVCLLHGFTTGKTPHLEQFTRFDHTYGAVHPMSQRGDPQSRPSESTISTLPSISAPEHWRAAIDRRGKESMSKEAMTLEQFQLLLVCRTLCREIYDQD